MKIRILIINFAQSLGHAQIFFVTFINTLGSVYIRYIHTSFHQPHSKRMWHYNKARGHPTHCPRKQKNKTKMAKEISSILGKLQKPMLSIDILTVLRGDGKVEQKVLRYENSGGRPLSTVEERIINELALNHFEASEDQTYNFSIYTRSTNQNDSRRF